MQKDYYEILGISKDATSEEVTHAFHRLAKKHHPDRPGGSSERFKEISEAYQVLSNREKRSAYDSFGSSEGFNFSQGGYNQFWQDFRGFDFGKEGDASGFGFGFEDVLGDLFGFETASKKSASVKRGKSIAVDIEIDLEDTLYGKDKEVALERFTVCSICHGRGAELGSPINECKTCRGSGRVQELQKIPFGTITRSAPCPECHGEGKLIEKLCKECRGEGRMKVFEKLKVRIPAGVSSGEEIQYRQMGDAGKRGASTGDLFARVFVREHPLFMREGDNIFIKIPMSFSKATLGEKIEVPTLEGPVLLKIPAGIDSGKVLRLKGKGIPRVSGNGRGDELVEIVIKTPKNLTGTQEELMKKLREEGL